uniref:Free fatty acid receptor 3-like n=1 Tax=Cyanistes caeruleus TaxID=156563 RepID=A0A8C0Z7Y9_CYACU
MSSTLVLTVYILTFTIGFPANIFTLTVLATKCGRSNPSLTSCDLLLLNLTFSDLLLLLFLPLKMAEAAAGMVWPLPDLWCPLVNFCFYSSMYLSGLFLAALSVRRYLGVVFPLRFRDRRRPGRVLAVSAVIWLVACGHCSVVFVAELGGKGDTGDVGGIGDPRVDPKVDPKVDPIDPKVDLDPKVDPIDPKVDPVDPKTFNPLDPKVDPVDPKVDPIDLKVDPKTFNLKFFNLKDPKPNPNDPNDPKPNPNDP